MLKGIAAGFRWFLGLNDDQRQNLTTLSMMGGTIALTAVTAGILWMIRYSWPTHILTMHAGAIIDGLFNLSYGLLALMAVQIVAQAVIAIGGKMKAGFGPASIEASSDADD